MVGTIIAIVILMVVLITILRDTGGMTEDFATKREKAQELYSWMQANPSGKYSQYKNKFGTDSNIVDYEALTARAQRPGFTVGAVEKII